VQEASAHHQAMPPQGAMEVMAVLEDSQTSHNKTFESAQRQTI
jgi:hypothetical protein